MKIQRPHTEFQGHLSEGLSGGLRCHNSVIVQREAIPRNNLFAIKYRRDEQEEDFCKRISFNEERRIF